MPVYIVRNVKYSSSQRERHGTAYKFDVKALFPSLTVGLSLNCYASALYTQIQYTLMDILRFYLLSRVLVQHSNLKQTLPLKLPPLSVSVSPLSMYFTVELSPLDAFGVVYLAGFAGVEVVVVFTCAGVVGMLVSNS